jgi:membrane associated rhomboid family serine protease
LYIPILLFWHSTYWHLYLGGYAEKSVGILRYIVIYILAGIIGALLYGVVATYILGNTHTVLIGASGATFIIRTYYWLLFQIVFAVIGSVTAIPIAFTAHIEGFVAGLLLTKMLIQIERNLRTKHQNPSEGTYDTWK